MAAAAATASYFSHFGGGGYLTCWEHKRSSGERNNQLWGLSPINQNTLTHLVYEFRGQLKENSSLLQIVLGFSVILLRDFLFD